MLAMRHRGRADAVGAVVPADARDGRPRDQGGEGRRHDLLSEVVGEDVLQLARKYSRLVYLAAAVVGSSDSGLPMRTLRPSDRRGGAALAMPRMRRLRYHP